MAMVVGGKVPEVVLKGIREAEEARDRSIAQAVQHANAETPAWSAIAMDFLLKYVKDQGSHPFTCEVVRATAKNAGVPDAPDARAWGGIVRSAALVGVIKSAGMTKNVHRHRGYATQWVWTGMARK